MTDSNRKGKRGERELARLLREEYPDVVRTYGQSRKGSDAPDLAGLTVNGHRLWVECKRGKRVNIRAALRQAAKEAVMTRYTTTGGGLGLRGAPVSAHAMPIAITRADRDEWIVTMTLRDWMAVCRRADGGKLRS